MQAKKATTVLKEAMETCRALTEDKEALMEQLEKAIHDKEENASALADSLATVSGVTTFVIRVKCCPVGL